MLLSVVLSPIAVIADPTLVSGAQVAATAVVSTATAAAVIPFGTFIATGSATVPTASL